MSEAGATAVSFTLLAWVLIWWVAFELWPELRAAKLRLRLRRMQMEHKSPELFDSLDRAAQQAGEFRWLPLLAVRPREPASPEQERAAWELVRHAARGAPWMWPVLRSEEGRRRWTRRALGLLEALSEREPRRRRDA